MLGCISHMHTAKNYSAWRYSCKNILGSDFFVCFSERISVGLSVRVTHAIHNANTSSVASFLCTPGTDTPVGRTYSCCLATRFLIRTISIIPLIEILARLVSLMQSDRWSSPSYPPVQFSGPGFRLWWRSKGSCLSLLQGWRNIAGLSLLSLIWQLILQLSLKRRTSPHECILHA